MRISREDILNYLNRKLSEKDRYEFEKSMLEDPFLNDAVEGLQSMEDPEAIGSILDQLDLEVSTRVEKHPPSSSLRWIAGVAAVLVVVITSVLILYFPLNPQKEHLSLNQIPEIQVPEKDIPSVTDSEDEGIAEESTVAKEVVETPQEATSEPGEKLSEANVQADSEKDTDETVEIIAAREQLEEQVGVEQLGEQAAVQLMDEADDEIIVFEDVKDIEGVKEEENIENKRGAGEPMLAVVREEINRYKSKSNIISKLQPEKLNGLVTGPRGLALPGVNVIAPDRGDGAITNDAGEFQFNNYIIGLNLLFTKTGYLDKKITLAEPFKDISLDEATETANYDVVSNVEIYFDQIPAPHIGRERYLVYLNGQIELINDELNRKDIVPTVVEMQLNELGEIINLKIISDNNTELAERTLKMVQEGSGWLPAILDGRSIDARIHIQVIYRGNRGK